MSSVSTSAESAPLSNLNICRNKHWRFISSYHGQWLQLPLELLESLAYSNHFSPRPRIIDTAVFFDVVRIRRLVDEATNLSVRATNGTISSALSTNLNAGHGVHRNGAKLSGERKFRMREMAVKKLSEAYHLDEIAASVATMQSASSLDDVAKTVLQRAPNDVRAKYVHFFHEKIPSRALAESTSLRSLNEILEQFPSDCAVLRTRAVTSVIKDDYAGAVQDLTNGLSYVPRDAAHHFNYYQSADSNRAASDTRYDVQKLNDDQKPTGVQAQLYFQRATVHLNLACQSVDAVLKTKWPLRTEPIEQIHLDSEGVFGQGLLAYQKVKLNAKRALRDFTFFLSKLDYSPGLAVKSNGQTPTVSPDNEVEREIDGTLDSSQLKPDSKTSVNGNKTTKPGSDNLPIRIYQVSDLFSPTPPTNLPPFPLIPTSPSEQELTKASQHNQIINAIGSERVTYHPLLSESLHGLLLCHALLQTDINTLHKHACMVARLVSISDGHPVFVPSRSASRADWTDILSRTKDWLELDDSWDNLCESMPTGNEAKARTSHQTKAQLSLESTGTNTKSPGGTSSSETPPASHHLDLKAYSLGTDRAAIIKRWITDAPCLPDAPTKTRKGKKKKATS